MDALAGLLAGPRARGAFLIRSVLTPPWAIRVEDRAPLTLITPVRGTAWVLPDHGAAVRLATGDVAIARGPDAYVLADTPTTPPRVVIHPDQSSSTPAGDGLCETMALGTRTWGDATDGPDVLLSGTYQLRGEVSRGLLEALPPLLVVTADSWHSPLIDLLGEEIGKDLPGQDAVLDRLLDLLLIATLRSWLARPESDAPAWYRAHTDPLVGHALRLLHGDLAHPWTVAGLAAEVGVSRAALARRFAELVGEPPMSYLTRRRLALAADLLHDPAATLGSVAHRVGYGSPFALSTAFKRVHGVSPQEHRSAGPVAAGG